MLVPNAALKSHVSPAKPQRWQHKNTDGFFSGEILIRYIKLCFDNSLFCKNRENYYRKLVENWRTVGKWTRVRGDKMSWSYPVQNN